MPNIANKQFFESIVPREADLKRWLFAVSDALGLDYLTTEYYYLDKRAANLARSRLLHARATSQRVRLKHSIHLRGNHESNQERGQHSPKRNR